MRDKKYVDLHTHTYYSDGTCQPRQIVIDSAMLGMEVLAITDHDHTAGYEEARNEAKRWGLEVITGTEISAGPYHVLGYDFDMKNKELKDLLAYSRNCQENITKERVRRMRAADIPITFEKVRGYFPESRLGKLNVLMTMILDEECRNYTGDMRGTELFNTYFRKGCVGGGVRGFPEVNTQEAIDGIHAAGGLAVIAHPFKDVKDLADLERLIAQGMDGIEVQPNFGERNDFYKQYALDHNMLITYGSDFHGPRNHRRPLLARGENKIEPFYCRRKAA